MKQSYFTCLALAFIISSCNNQPEKAPPTIQKISTAHSSDCYSSFKNNDTIRLTMTIMNDTVMGNLKYSLFGKDKNDGSIYGHFSGDTLFADYSFMSEGKESIREIAFLKRGDSLSEGYGDVEEKNGKFIFKNKAGLTFGAGIVLEKCPD